MSASSDVLRDADGQLHRALLACAVQPTATPADRERAVLRLLELAGGRRVPLDRLRREFHGRLTHRSDDFEATQGLRLAEGALDRIPRSEGPWTWQARALARRKQPRG